MKVEDFKTAHFISDGIYICPETMEILVYQYRANWKDRVPNQTPEADEEGAVRKGMQRL